MINVHTTTEFSGILYTHIQSNGTQYGKLSFPYVSINSVRPCVFLLVFRSVISLKSIEELVSVAYGPH